ncbi:MAG: pseudouridine-5'-phosphate glycosidase [Anaeromyxobacteraceae bacterium]
MATPAFLEVRAEVAAALAAGRPVVALETSVVAQGLPPPHGATAAARCEAAVRAAGALPATVAVLGGRLVVGATAGEVAALADRTRPVAKAAARDLGPLVAAGRDAGTTVSATVLAAGLAGIPVVATGGLGGVHRLLPGDPPAAAGDVSADLYELARTPVCVVCAGPKVILDVPATAELLESLGVPILGFGTSELPAFYVASSGVALEHRVDDPGAAARAVAAHLALGRGGLVLAVPPPAPLPGDEVEAALAGALATARARGAVGKAATPLLLEALATATRGRAVEANLALLERNAAVAGDVARALRGRAG